MASMTLDVDHHGIVPWLTFRTEWILPGRFDRGRQLAVMMCCGERDFNLWRGAFEDGRLIGMDLRDVSADGSLRAFRVSGRVTSCPPRRTELFYGATGARLRANYDSPFEVRLAIDDASSVYPSGSWL